MDTQVDRKTMLADRWVNDDNFHVKVRDRAIASDPTALEMLAQIDHLMKLFRGRYVSLVEVGCGDGKMLDLIHRSGRFENVIGSDLAGHRLDEARKTFPHLQLLDADLLQMAQKYAKHTTVFLAMNVLGNIVQDELMAFLAKLEMRSTALVFSARDVPLDSKVDVVDKGMGFAYNYRELARQSGLTFVSSLHRYREDGRYQGGIIATLVREKQMNKFRRKINDGPL